MTTIERVDDDKNSVESMQNSEERGLKSVNGWLPMIVITLVVKVNKDRGYHPMTSVPDFPYQRPDKGFVDVLLLWESYPSKK